MILQNLLTIHQRLLANYLRRKGWVVFYLDERSRQCNIDCWLKLYNSEKSAG